MATVEDWRGRGIGERLALWCVSHARRHAARLVWCSARERAVAFYARLGFRAVGEPYELPQYSDERYVELHLRL
jgi:ribosomal protein S18 acetylase RimI-like enzyme